MSRGGLLALPTVAALFAATCCATPAGAIVRRVASNSAACIAPVGAYNVVRLQSSVVWQLFYRSGRRHVYRVTACLRRTGHRTALARFSAAGYASRPNKITVSEVRSAGDFVVFSQVANDKYNDGTVGFVEFNLARGGQRVTFTAHDFGGNIGDGYRVRDFAVNAAGFLAWRAEQSGATQPFSVIVVADRHGIRTIDSGAPNAFTGPSMQGNTVFWTKSGTAVSAQLS